MCSNEHYIDTDYTEIQIFTYSLSIDEKIRLKSQRQKLRYNLKSSCSLSSRTLEQTVNLVVKVLFTAVSYALRAKPLWQQKIQILDPPFLLAQWCLRKKELNIVHNYCKRGFNWVTLFHVYFWSKCPWLFGFISFSKTLPALKNNISIIFPGL